MLLDFGDGVGLLEGSWSSFNPAEIPSGPIIYGSDGKKMIEWGKTLFGVESKHIIGEKVRFAGKDDECDVELQINAKGMHCRRDGEIKTISNDATYGSEETFKILVNTLKKIKGRS
jgi:hypothetical protein